MIGFTSLIGEDGVSELFPGIPSGEASRYSLFDKFLYWNDGGTYKSLIINTDCNNTIFNPDVDIMSPMSCGDIVFRFPGSTDTEPIYYEFPYTSDDGEFKHGSYFSHFDCGLSTQYLMSYTSDPGDAYIKRQPDISEVRVLKTLGYNLSGTFGEPGQPHETVYTDTWLDNYSHLIAGTNDYRSMLYDDIPTGIVINIDAILANDYSGSDDFIGISCLEITLAGYGAYIVETGLNTGSSFTFMPESENFTGKAILKYRPVNSDGQLGNMTYIFVDIETPPLPTCDEDNCNLICIGTFENTVPAHMEYFLDYNIWPIFNPPPIPISSPDFMVIEQKILHQSDIKRNPSPCFFDLWHRDPVTSWYKYENGTKIENEKFINVYFDFENITIPLNKPIDPTKDYVLSFDALAVTGYPDFFLDIYASENLPCNGCDVPVTIEDEVETDCADGSTFKPFLIVDDFNLATSSDQVSFKHTEMTIYSSAFSGNENLNYIILDGKLSAKLSIDNISLVEITPINISSDVSNPTPCIGEEFTITYTFTRDNFLIPEILNIEYLKPIGIDVVSPTPFPTTVDFNGELSAELTLILMANISATPGGKHSVLCVLWD